MIDAFRWKYEVNPNPNPNPNPISDFEQSQEVEGKLDSIFWMVMNGGLIFCAFIAFVLSMAVGDTVSDQFISWYEANGGYINGLTINEFPRMGRGFLALKNLEEGSVILRIPRELQFSLEQMKKSADLLVKRLAELVTDGDIAIAAWILLEKYRGIDSFFASYIKVLPQHVSSVLYFSEDDLEALQEPDFIDQIKQFQRTTAEEFEQLQRVIESDKSNTLALLSENLTQDDYVWACTIINSRGLRFRGQLYLSPMADVFNYAPHPEPRLAQNGNHFLKHHILYPNNGTLTILSDRFCSEGNQVLEDYGDNPNQIYLQYHGFVPLENPFNCIRIFAQNVILSFRKEHILNDLKLKIISKLGLDRPFSDCVNERGAISRSMGGLLAIASLNPKTVEACLEAVSVPNPNYKEALQICHVEQVITYLNKHITSKAITDLGSEDTLFYAQITQNVGKLLHAEFSRTYRFDTTLEEDMHLVSQKVAPLSTYTELAVRYRLSNKQLKRKLAKIFGIQEYPMVSTTTDAKHAPAVSLEVDASFGDSYLVNSDSTKESTAQQDQDLSLALDHFNSWFNAANPQVNKLKAVVMPRYRIGTITTDSIAAEDTYLSVPVSIIMDSEKAFLYSGVSSLLQTLSMKYKTRDDFHELLFFLLYETFFEREKSQFWPYLAVLPRVEDVQVPLVWEQEQIMRLLSPSFVASTAVNYRSRTLKKFDFLSNLTEVKDFFGAWKDTTGGSVFTLERYLWATAIIDSRSIWWSGRRHLVPMLDFINCEEHQNNPGRVHATSLDASEQFAVTKAGTSYAAGDQLFENYGQPNHIYYLYHGFILEENTHDCVSFEISFNQKEWQALRSHGVNDYLEQLDINDRNRKYSTCLSAPLNPQVWNVVGLLGTESLIKEENGLKLPNKPTINSAKRMRKLLKDRLALYKDVSCTTHKNADKDLPWSHIAAKMFLCSEKSILNSLLHHVRDILSELEDEDL